MSQIKGSISIQNDCWRAQTEKGKQYLMDAIHLPAHSLVRLHPVHPANFKQVISSLNQQKSVDENRSPIYIYRRS